MTVFEQLKRRGLIAQMTHEQEIKYKLEHEKCTFYIGFDATADSLHVGHFLQLVVMRHLQMAGHKPIALLGTGTTLVGDPTGRSDMRQMLSEEEISYNAECFKRQMSRMIDFSNDKALILKNGDWLSKLNYIEFLRTVGRYFSVNKMLTAECVKSRLENGLSFLEFNYMLMQSYDFLKLYEDYDCTMELGGDDQWSNILGGIELIRRVKAKQAYGMTFSLLTTKEGKKMGKTQGGAVWLDAKKYSPYDFYQYWRNVDDADAIHCLKMLTFLPIEEIEAMESWEGETLNRAKEMLAFEVTKMVHGEELANKSMTCAKMLFVSGKTDDNMPLTILNEEAFENNVIGLLALMVKCKLCQSNAQARRLVQQGGIVINDEKITDPAVVYPKEAFANGVVIKKGKKTFHRAVIK